MVVLAGADHHRVPAHGHRNAKMIKRTIAGGQFGSLRPIAPAPGRSYKNVGRSVIVIAGRPGHDSVSANGNRSTQTIPNGGVTGCQFGRLETVIPAAARSLEDVDCAGIAGLFVISLSPDHDGIPVDGDGKAEFPGEFAGDQPAHFFPGPGQNWV